VLYSCSTLPSDIPLPAGRRGIADKADRGWILEEKIVVKAPKNHENTLKAPRPVVHSEVIPLSARRSSKTS